MAQKYFGSPARKMKADQANQIFGLDAEGKPSYGVPLSNYMNAQVCLIQVSGKVFIIIMSGMVAVQQLLLFIINYQQAFYVGVETKRATSEQTAIMMTPLEHCAQYMLSGGVVMLSSLAWEPRDVGLDRIHIPYTLVLLCQALFMKLAPIPL